jgi:hypothetical protein
MATPSSLLSGKTGAEPAAAQMHGNTYPVLGYKRMILD